MTRAIAILCLLLSASCKTNQEPVGPDPSLFPNKSEDWKDGFRKGFHEGLVWNTYTTQAP